MIKIAVAQCNFLVGDITGNAKRIIQETQKITQRDAADLIIFPELALSGYPPEDLLFRPGFYHRCERALADIVAHTQHTAIIMGFPARDQQGKLYNKAAVIANQKMIAEYVKQELPNYTVFDEKRYFTAGQQSCVFDFHNMKIGLLICEDIWHAGPISQAKEAGAELIISINASPYDKNQVVTRKNMLKKRAQETQLPIVYANLVGGQDELVFDGGSMVIDAQGECCQQAAFCREDVMLVSIEKKSASLQITSCITPTTLSTEAQLYDVLKLGVRDYIVKNHFPGALVGLSGGIDSALTLAIAVDAIGADNVTAVLMPSQYTRKMSMEDALLETKALGVSHLILPIDEILQCYLKILSPVFQKTTVGTTEENLQARIRGMLLMALSNKFGKIVLTTGNKSEYAVGYTTLYGDMAGGFAVLKDVPKTLVYQLAHFRNQQQSPIPERVLTRAPTAELAPNQTDQDKLPPYSILDEIVERYIEKDEEPTQLYQAGFPEKMVDDVINMINHNEYKRRQAPIGIRLTQRAFGKDRRYPITSGYARTHST